MFRVEIEHKKILEFNKWNSIEKKTNKLHVIDCLKIEQKTITDCGEIANTFGEYFLSVGRKLAQNMKPSKRPITQYINKISPNKKSLYLHPTNHLEVQHLIDDLPNKNSSGHDDINNVILKKISTTIVHPLVEIFNISMSEGKFPQWMKCADVVPLYKSKHKDNSINY